MIEVFSSNYSKVKVVSLKWLVIFQSRNLAMPKFKSLQAAFQHWGKSFFISLIMKCNSEVKWRGGDIKIILEIVLEIVL